LALHGNSLVLSGERKVDESDGGSETSRAERFFGRFQRALDLPKPVNGAGVTATYKNGILTVTLPKTEESKPKQIEVKSF
jgi:HSP20 family protein